MNWLTVKPLLYVCAGLFMACIVLGSGWYSTHAALRVAKATHQAEKDKAAREFTEAARKVEQEQARKYAEVEARHQRELSDARKTAERVAADLRSGALRLRDEWSGCETDRRVSEAAASAARDAERARLRVEGASALIAIGRECDARIRGLQRLTRTPNGSH